MLCFAAGFASIFVFYNALGLLLQDVYYVRAGCIAAQWRIQHSSSAACWSPPTLPPVANVLLGKCLGDKLARSFLGHSPETGEGNERQRAANHDVICTCNLLLASLAAGVVIEATARGRSGIVFSSVEETGGWGAVALATGGAIAWQLVWEYYWHRMMHLPWFYRRFHKMHHFYKSPQPFDDMYIHPLEATGYYLILYSPAFVFRLHWIGFVVYMAVMGTCGVLDHCGIRLGVLGIYNTTDHDMHHQHFNCNYAFPFVFLDLIHGTFAGQFLGRDFFPPPHVRSGKIRTR